MKVGRFVGIVTASMAVVLALGTGCRSKGSNGYPASAATSQGGGGGGGTGGSGGNDPGVPPGGPLASDTILVSVSQATGQSLSIYGVDTATGGLGTMAGSPADVGVPAGPAASIALDVANRRLFVASDLASTIAVTSIDAHGAPVPAAGSPFATESSGPSAIGLGPNSATLYVGYSGGSSISEYAVDATSGALTKLAGSPVSLGGGRGPASFARLGDLLFVACKDTSNIRTIRIAGDGSVSASGQLTATLTHPIDLKILGSRLYASLCDCDGNKGSIDVFDINATAGTITRIPGAPFQFAGLDGFPHLAIHPSGTTLAVSIRTPPQIALFGINADGSVVPQGSQPLHTGNGGPQTLAWSADGQFLYVADNSDTAGTAGIYVLELVSGALRASTPLRYTVPGGPVGIAVGKVSVAP